MRGGGSGKERDSPVPKSQDASGKTLLHAHHTHERAHRRAPGSMPSVYKMGGRKEVGWREGPELLGAAFGELRMLQELPK